MNHRQRVDAYMLPMETKDRFEGKFETMDGTPVSLNERFGEARMSKEEQDVILLKIQAKQHQGDGRDVLRQILEEQHRKACVKPTTLSTSVEISEKTVAFDASFEMPSFEMPDAYKTLV